MSGQGGAPGGWLVPAPGRGSCARECAPARAAQAVSRQVGSLAHCALTFIISIKKKPLPGAKARNPDLSQIPQSSLSCRPLYSYQRYHSPKKVDAGVGTSWSTCDVAGGAQGARKAKGLVKKGGLRIYI